LTSPGRRSYQARSLLILRRPRLGGARCPADRAGVTTDGAPVPTGIRPIRRRHVRSCCPDSRATLATGPHRRHDGECHRACRTARKRAQEKPIRAGTSRRGWSSNGTVDVAGVRSHVTASASGLAEQPSIVGDAALSQVVHRGSAGARPPGRMSAAAVCTTRTIRWSAMIAGSGLEAGLATVRKQVDDLSLQRQQRSMTPRVSRLANTRSFASAGAEPRIRVGTSIRRRRLAEGRAQVFGGRNGVLAAVSEEHGSPIVPSCSQRCKAGVSRASECGSRSACLVMRDAGAVLPPCRCSA
jgi:hypothetical protein